MAFARAVLALSAVPFAVIGLAFLVQPVPMAQLVGLEMTNATADADVRAVYGGLQLGCAFLLASAAYQARWVRPGLVAQLALYGSLGSARFISYALVGLPSPLGLALHFGELVGVVCGALAWRAAGRQSRRPVG